MCILLLCIHIKWYDKDFSSAQYGILYYSMYVIYFLSCCHSISLLLQPQSSGSEAARRIHSGQRSWLIWLHSPILTVFLENKRNQSCMYVKYMHVCTTCKHAIIWISWFIHLIIFNPFTSLRGKTHSHWGTDHKQTRMPWPESHRGKRLACGVEMLSLVASGSGSWGAWMKQVRSCTQKWHGCAQCMQLERVAFYLKMCFKKCSEHAVFRSRIPYLFSTKTSVAETLPDSMCFFNESASCVQGDCKFICDAVDRAHIPCFFRRKCASQ